MSAILHYDGTSWVRVEAPKVASATGNSAAMPGPEPTGGAMTQSAIEPACCLYGVDAISADEVWAVGFDSQERTLVERWDGSAWRIVPSPNAGAARSHLLDVAAISPNDVWAVGTYDEPVVVATRPLIMHWDGSTWAIVDYPEIDSSEARLEGVAAVSKDDVWAVGHYLDSWHQRNPLALHWDGSRWSTVALPDVDPLDEYVFNMLHGVSASSADNVWAVGGSQGIVETRPIVLHWDGKQWSAADEPLAQVLFDAVVAVSPASVWAAGGRLVSKGYHSSPVEIYHWTPAGWSKLSCPSPRRIQRLEALVAVSEDEVWAVGAAEMDGLIVSSTSCTAGPIGPAGAKKATATPGN